MQRVVVMGVAGSGKSTVGRRLSVVLGVDFVDADDLHPERNVRRMSAGESLTDEDRWPWLDLVAIEISAREGVVVACSALKRSYRERLRRAGNVQFVFLDVDRAEVERRIRLRPGHFMKSNMLDSQFEALEVPAADELDVVRIVADCPVDELATACAVGLSAL